MSHHNHDTHGEHSHAVGHIVPLNVFVAVLIALFVLTAITVGVSYIDFGAWNIVVAMVVASIKALLVALFFMHLKFEDPFTWAYAGLPLIILGLLLGGVFIDNPTRIYPDPVVIKSESPLVQSK